MTSTTSNLSLTLYDSSTDQTITFATFRAVWGGPASTSNFYRIDTAYGVQAAQITSLQGTRGAIPVGATYDSANYYIASGITIITAYTVGMTIILGLDTTSDGTVTLNINTLGTKSLMKNNSSGTPINLTGSDLVKGRQYLFIYDGTRWLWVSANSADQIEIVGTVGNLVTVGTDNALLGTTTQAGMLADTTHAATTKTTPVDADEIPIWNSVGSVLGKLTWANLKATLLVLFMDLATAQTVTGAKTFNDTKFILAGSSSGTTTVKSGATAGTSVITLPVATDTLVGKATTDTLTNKRVTARASTETSSATPTINTDNVDYHSVTALAEAITSMTTNLSGTPTINQKLWIAITGTGARAITWGTSFEAGAVALPTTTVTTQRLDVGFAWNGITNKWRCMASGSA